MQLTVEPFGQSGRSLYTFRNDSGMTLTVSDLGAVVTSIVVPDRDGRSVDVTLGYSSSDGYAANESAYGATVGRFANRIRDAELPLDGRVHHLEANEGRHALHGGPHPYYVRHWQARVDDAEEPSVTFTLVSPDGDQGMPGTAEIEVSYALTRQNEVVIRYHAVADQDTVFNLTNHSYFNLDGHDAGLIDQHLLWLDCDYFTPIDREFIPTGEVRKVDGTALDFTRAKTIGHDVDADDEQVEFGHGFDHNLVINSPDLARPFARVESTVTGIVMEVATDLPGVQLYGGNNMGGGTGEKGSAPYVRRGGLCLETQYYPDTPHHANFPTCLFRAGEPFSSTTIYRFVRPSSIETR